MTNKFINCSLNKRSKSEEIEDRTVKVAAEGELN